MRVLGISVDPGGGRPRLHGVVLSGAEASLSVDRAFELRSTDSAPPEQVVDLARLLEGTLPGIEFDRAVLRVAGPSPVARRNKAQFSRAHAEGAVLFVLREHLGFPVIMGDVQSLAKLAGISKDRLLELAASLNSKPEPTSAAVSGLLAKDAI